MLEVSLAPKDRLMYLLRYSRPTGTNKKARSLVVNKKKSDDVRELGEDAKNKNLGNQIGRRYQNSSKGKRSQAGGRTTPADQEKITGLTPKPDGITDKSFRTWNRGKIDHRRCKECRGHRDR